MATYKLDIPISDPGVAETLVRRADGAGPSGRLFSLSDQQLREYVATLNGGKFRPKDFRTLKGTLLAEQMVEQAEAPTDQKTYKKAVRQVAKKVAATLGNTLTVALQSYIDPTVFSPWSHVA